MKKMMIALASSATLALAACGTPEAETENDMVMDGDDTAMTDTMDEDNTVVAVAQGNADFSTLVSAVQQADLVDTLNGAGPYTIFAPTNAAFDKVDSATLEGLMADGQQEELGNLLKYHVVSGETMAGALTQLIEENGGTAELETVAGGTLTASVRDGNVVLTDGMGNEAMVTQTDLDASNGVIHVIDTVLMPAS